MPHALNLTMPIKQDADTQARLKHIAEVFAAEIQPKIDKALRESKIVHSARVLVIDNKYLQVITSYDGDHREYTEFFRRELPDVFAILFSLAEGTPSQEAMGEPEAFFNFAAKHQIRALGNSVDGSTDADSQPAGYLFSAFGTKTVEEILPKLDR